MFPGSWRAAAKSGGFPGEAQLKPPADTPPALWRRTERWYGLVHPPAQAHTWQAALAPSLPHYQSGYTRLSSAGVRARARKRCWRCHAMQRTPIGCSRCRGRAQAHTWRLAQMAPRAAAGDKRDCGGAAACPLRCQSSRRQRWSKKDKKCKSVGVTRCARVGAAWGVFNVAGGGGRLQHACACRRPTPASPQQGG